MQLTSTSFKDGEKIPGEFAFCIPDPAHHVCLGRNLNPPFGLDRRPARHPLLCRDLPRSRRTEPGRRCQLRKAAAYRPTCRGSIFPLDPGRPSADPAGNSGRRISRDVTPRVNLAPRRPTAPARESTTTLAGSPATTTCAATTTATTAPAHRGTTNCCTTTSLPFSPSMSEAARRGQAGRRRGARGDARPYPRRSPPDGHLQPQPGARLTGRPASTAKAAGAIRRPFSWLATTDKRSAPAKENGRSRLSPAGYGRSGHERHDEERHQIDDLDERFTAGPAVSL